MADSLPTIIFFPGACSHPSCFDRLVPHLQKAGYPTVYASLPSLNPTEPALASSTNDAERTRKDVLLPLIEDQHRDVVVFAHSYGGVVGGAAAAGLSKSSRMAQKELGGVIGLLYLVGNIVQEGETLLQAVGGAYPPFMKENTPSAGLAVIDPVIPTLYADADPSLTSLLEAAMTPHALTAFETPAPAPAWAESTYNGRRAYIRTLDDQCNPLFLQEAWIEKSKVDWEIADLKSSHGPFISQPEELAATMTDFIRKWISLKEQPWSSKASDGSAYV